MSTRKIYEKITVNGSAMVKVFRDTDWNTWKVKVYRHEYLSGFALVADFEEYDKQSAIESAIVALDIESANIIKMKSEREEKALAVEGIPAIKGYLDAAETLRNLGLPEQAAYLEKIANGAVAYLTTIEKA